MFCPCQLNRERSFDFPADSQANTSCTLNAKITEFSICGIEQKIEDSCISPDWCFFEKGLRFYFTSERPLTGDVSPRICNFLTCRRISLTRNPLSTLEVL